MIQIFSYSFVFLTALASNFENNRNDLSGFTMHVAPSIFLRIVKKRSFKEFLLGLLKLAFVDLAKFLFNEGIVIKVHITCFSLR